VGDAGKERHSPPIWPPTEWEEENREERCLQKQAVPLKIEERAAHGSERQVEQPQKQDAQAGAKSPRQSDRKQHADHAEHHQKPVARIQPAHRWDLPVGSGSQLPMRGVQEFTNRNYASLPCQPTDLERASDPNAKMKTSASARAKTQRDTA